MPTITAPQTGAGTSGVQLPSRHRGTLRSWLLVQRGYWLDYLILAVVFVVSYVAVLLSRTHFVPDSRYYLGMALWFGGDSQTHARAIVQAISEQHGYPAPSVQEMFGWGLVQPRVVLPLLAAPFVGLLGSTALSLVTGIATLALLLVLYGILSKRFNRPIAVAVLVLTMTSPLIMFFSTAMLTESLSALWGALALVFAWRYQRDPQARWLIVLVVVTALSAFTRQATFIVAGAFIVAWILSRVIPRTRRGWGLPALVVAVTAVVLQILQVLVFPSFSEANQFEKVTGTTSLGGAILASPRLLLHILHSDVVSFAHSDLAVLVLIVLAVISMIVFWRRSESHLLLGALLGIALYNVTNGTPTEFRYSMPGLVFFVVSVALLARSAGRLRGQAANASEVETPSSALP
jgi:hypothetical protein